MSEFAATTRKAAGLALGAGAIYFGAQYGADAVHGFENFFHIGGIGTAGATFVPKNSWVSHLTHPDAVVVAQADGKKDMVAHTGGGVAGGFVSFLSGSTLHPFDHNYDVPIEAKIQVLEGLGNGKQTDSGPSPWKLSWYKNTQTAYDLKGNVTTTVNYGIKETIDVANTKFVMQAADPHCQGLSTNPQECKGQAKTSFIEKAIPYITIGTFVLAPEVGEIGLFGRLLLGGGIAAVEDWSFGSAPDPVKSTLALTYGATSDMLRECQPLVASIASIKVGDQKMGREILNAAASAATSDGHPDSQQRAEALSIAANKVPIKVEYVNSDGSPYRSKYLPIIFAEPKMTEKKLGNMIGGKVTVLEPKGGAKCIPTKNFSTKPAVAKQPVQFKNGKPQV